MVTCYRSITCITWRLQEIITYHQNKSDKHKTPSNQRLKAFPVLKFNSKTSFLYQLFKENLNSYFQSRARSPNSNLFFLSLNFYLFIYSHIHRHCLYVLFSFVFILFWLGFILLLQLKSSNPLPVFKFNFKTSLLSKLVWIQILYF